jgi:peptidoglycan hydrolase CwlO-like protein
MEKKKKILIDTDIGDDIDDALALFFAMKLDFDIVGITTVFQNTVLRARLVKKLLKGFGNGYESVPVYAGHGEPIDDPANPGSYQKEGPGTAAEILGQLFDRAKEQQAVLNTTRAELANARTKIETLVNEYNKLKPEGRQDKLTIEELKQKVADTEAAKAEAEEQVKKTKAQVDELSAEVVSLKDEVSSAKDETDAVKEDLAKSQKLVEQLKTLLQKQQQPVAAQAASGGVSAAQVTAGNKGKIVAVDNAGMFAVVEMSDEAMNELIGEERKNGLPLLEMALRRNGFKGPSGEYIGRIRLRQAISGKNLVIVDVLGDWKQADIKVGDVVFAE